MNQIVHLQCNASRILKLCFASFVVVLENRKNDGCPGVPLEVVNILWEGLLSLRKGLDDLENENETWRRYISPQERNAFIETALQHAEAKNARLRRKSWLNNTISGLPLFVSQYITTKTGQEEKRFSIFGSQYNPTKTGQEEKKRFTIFDPQPDSMKTGQEKNRRRTIFFWDKNCNEEDLFGTSNNDKPFSSKNDSNVIVNTQFQETKPENKTAAPQGPHPSQAVSSTDSILQNNEIVPVVVEYIKDELKRLGLVDITIKSGSRHGRNRKSDCKDGVSDCSSITTDYVKDDTLSTIDNSATGVRSCSMKPPMKRDFEVQYLKVTRGAYQQYGINLSNLPISKGGFLIQKVDGEERMENDIQDHEDNSNLRIWSNLMVDSIVSKCERELISPMVLESSPMVLESSPQCPKLCSKNSDDKFYWLFLHQDPKRKNDLIAEDVWIYILLMFPYHLMHAGRVEDALELLSRQFFVLNRITVLGIKDGLQRYQKDCELYFHVIKEKTEDSKKVTMSIFYVVLGFLTTKYPSAKDIGRKSITIFLYRNESSDGIDDTQKKAIGKGLHKFASSMLSREWKEEALEFYSEASKYLSSVKGDRCDLAPTLRNMALLYARQGEYSEAIKLYKGLLMIQKESIGNDELSIAETLKYLGIAYGIEEEYKRAASYFEKELLIRKARLSEDNDLILDTYRRLGKLYTVMEQLDDAHACYSKCLDGYKLHGNNDGLLADIYHRLGQVLDKKGNKNGAISYYTEALNVAAHLNGKDYIVAAKILQSLGKIYSEQKKQADAVSCYRQSMKIRIKLEGENNKYVAETLGQLGNIYIHDKDYDQALETFKEAHCIAESICENNQFLHDTMCSLGMAYRMKGDLANATRCFGKAAQLRVAKLGKEASEEGNREQQEDYVYTYVNNRQGAIAA